MTRRFWAPALMLVAVATYTWPALAEAPIELPAKTVCALDDADSFKGLRRSDAFRQGEVVLTFDDGPQPVPTKKLLDVLDEHGYSATFFVVGLWIRASTFGLIQRMVKSGHDIGTHTYSHDLYLTRRGWGVDYIEGQYALTHVLVELALLARSSADFDELYRRVFEREPGVILSPATVRAHWRDIERRHFLLLSEHGHSAEARLYPMLFARPPGGIPYEGRWPKSMRDQHETALRHLGLLNVLWHGGSGDTVLGRLDEPQFLLQNVRFHTRRGGILLVHDRMRSDALEQAMQRIAKDPRIRVTTLRAAAEAKYSCEATQLYAALQPARRLAERAQATAHAP
jgi:Polysaccharide deacetylase